MSPSSGLPTDFPPPPGRVLVTGATGFIGRRLVPALLREGVVVRCLSRQQGASAPSGAERVRGDLLQPDSLPAALAGIDTIYYLVHSLAASRTDFTRLDRQAAGNLVAAAAAAGVRRIIYLGGLGDPADRLSEHLASRHEVAEVLSGGRLPTTVLRAAVIIGAGGASFEIIRALVDRLPVMLTPIWVNTRCQPIAVDDVVRYLVGCLFDERTTGTTFDICGPEVLSYKQMMESVGRIEGRINLFFPIPLFTPRLSAFWVGLVTPVKASIAMPLIEGLRNEVVCSENRIRDLIPFPLTPFDEAVRRALAEDGVSLRGQGP